MNAVTAAQESAVDVKQIGVLLIPGKARLNGDTRIDILLILVRLSCLRCLHAFRNGVSPGDNPGAPCCNTGRSLRGGRLSPARTSARLNPNSAMVRLSVLRCIPNSSAALHWFPRCAISTSRRNCPLELADRIFVADSAGMHLRHQAIQFSSHVYLYPFFLNCHHYALAGAVEKAGISLPDVQQALRFFFDQVADPNRTRSDKL